MSSRLVEMFDDEILGERIKNRLPHLFTIAELESSRAGKIGMEVGSVREKILIALLIYKFGEEKVETKIPITESEVDVKLFGKPVSIKTITGLGGVKVIWTVDAEKAREFVRNYIPTSDILLAQINWGKNGGLFCIPVEVQKRILSEIGIDRYLKLPKIGTNPRGIEINKDGLLMLIEHRGTKSIEILWQRSQIEYNPYKRWIEYWR